MHGLLVPTVGWDKRELRITSSARDWQLVRVLFPIVSGQRRPTRTRDPSETSRIASSLGEIGGAKQNATASDNGDRVMVGRHSQLTD